MRILPNLAADYGWFWNKTNFALYLAFASGTVVYYLLPLWAGVFTDAYGFSAKEIGFLLAADMGVHTLAALLSRFWIQSLPWRPVLVTTVVAALVANLLCIYSVDFVTMLSARLVCGFAVGSMVATVYSAFSSDPDPVRHFSVAMAMQILMGMVCLAVFPSFNNGINPGQVFWLITLLNLIPIFFVGCYPKRDSHGKAQRESESPHGVAIERRSYLFLLSVMLFFAAMTIIWVYMERMGVRLAFSEQTISRVLSISLLFSLAGSISPVFTSSRFSAHFSLYSSLAILLVVVLWMPTVELVLGYALVIFIYNFFYSYAIPFQAGLLSEMDTGGRSIVLLPAVQGIGIAIGPICAGFFIEAYSYVAAVYLSAVLMAGVFVVVKLSIRNQGTPVCG